MILSKEQKKFLISFSSQIEESCLRLKTDVEFTQSFKNVYFENGEGLLHILIKGYIYDYSRYSDITHHILNNSNLSLFDCAKDKTNAYHIFESHYDKIIHSFKVDTKTISLFSSKYIELLSFKTSVFKNNTLPIKVYFDALNFFIRYKQKEYIQKTLTLKTYNEQYTYCEKDLILIFSLDDPIFLERFLKKFNISKTQFSQYIFHHDFNENSKCNALSFCIRKNYLSIANHLLDKYPLLLNGQIENIERKNPFKETIFFLPYPLIDAIYINNISIFDKILSKMDIADILQCITIEQPYYPFSKKTSDIADYSQLEYICYSDSQYFDRIKPLFFEFSILKDNYLNVSLLKRILSSSCSFSHIKEMTNLLINHEHFSIPDGIIVPFFSVLLKNISHRINQKNQYTINDKDIYDITELYCLLKAKGLDIWYASDLYSPPIIKLPLLFSSLDSSGLNFNIQPKAQYHSHCLITEEYIEPLHILLKQNSLNDYYNDPHVLATLQFIYDKTIHTKNVSYSYSNTLEIIFHKQDSLVFSLLKEEDISFYKMKEYRNLLNFSVFSKLETVSPSYFEHIAPFLINSDIDLFTEINNFKLIYLFFKFNTSEIILDTLLKRHSQYIEETVSELSKNIHFWLHLPNDDNIWNYIKKNNANFSSLSTTKEILEYDIERHYILIEKYFEYGGIYPPCSSLKNIVKYKELTKCAFLFKKYPEMMRLVDEKNNYSLFYILRMFEKDIKNSEPQLKIYEEIIETYFLYDKIYTFEKTKKSQKPLNNVIEIWKGCHHIKESYPHLSTIFSYKILNNTLENKSHLTMRKIKV